MWIFWLSLGLFVGLLGAAVAARAILTRQLRAVRQAERRARSAERLAEIGAMTGGLAHEIKNPLSTIGLNAQLLGEGVEDSELDPDTKRRLTNRVGALKRETDRLRGILQDFLEYAGQIRLDARPTDVATIVSELVDFYHPEAARQGVMIRADLPGDPLTAKVDVRMFKQAMLNLIINATQAVAGESRSAVDAASAPPAARKGEVIVRGRIVPSPAPDHPPFVEVHVIDTGPGIAPDVVAKIFQPYFTTKSGGSGLGLPTARRIIEEHGGRLEVHSEPGRGSDFCVALPA